MERDKTEEMINVQRMSLELCRSLPFDPVLKLKIEDIDWDHELDANALHDLYRLFRLSNYIIRCPCQKPSETPLG